uniref:Uncharacterized protein n=1 Tax=Arundo donax TaxID=35708 RepID=A0A0A9EKT4_ARUDO
MPETRMTHELSDQPSFRNTSSYHSRTFNDSGMQNLDSSNMSLQ